MSYAVTQILLCRLVNVIYINFQKKKKWNEMNTENKKKKNITYPSGSENSLLFLQQSSLELTLIIKLNNSLIKFFNFDPRQHCVLKL